MGVRACSEQLLVPSEVSRLSCGILTKGVFGFGCGISGQWAQTFISGTSP